MPVAAALKDSRSADPGCAPLLRTEQGKEESTADDVPPPGPEHAPAAALRTPRPCAASAATPARGASRWATRSAARGENDGQHAEHRGQALHHRHVAFGDGVGAGRCRVRGSRITAPPHVTHGSWSTDSRQLLDGGEAEAPGEGVGVLQTRAPRDASSRPCPRTGEASASILPAPHQAGPRSTPPGGPARPRG